MILRSFLGMAACAVAGLAVLPASAVLNPSGNAETDTAAIQAAINAAPNGTVTLGTGSFLLNRALQISNGASLIGVGSDREGVLLAQTEKTNNVIVISASPNTVVSNLTMTAVADAASGVNMDSGLLVDCAITNIVTKNNSYYGGGVSMSGGTVRACLIKGCNALDSGGAGTPGEAIYMTDGLVENCVITQNGFDPSKKGDQYGSASWGGAICIHGKGTVRGCLVAHNWNRVCGTGITIVGPGSKKSGPQCVVENNTVVGNLQNHADSKACGIYVAKNHGASKDYNIVIRNNIVWGNYAFDGTTEANFNIDYVDMDSSSVEFNDSFPAMTANTSNISADPQFLDPANGNYRTRYSYCVDVGFNQDWMAGAVDLDGHARIAHDVVDLGCYEREVPQGLEGRFRLASDGSLDAARVSLEYDVIGGTANSAHWVFVRQQDRAEMTHEGFEPLFLPAGTWDARATLSDGSSAVVVESQGAVDVRASTVYANANGSATFPYDTEEKGTPSIDDAFPLVGVGGTLYVAKGDYVIANALNIEGQKGSRIVSLEGPEKTIIRLDNVETFQKKSFYGLTLSRSDAYVSGITLVGGRPGPHYSGAEYETRGLLKVIAGGAVVTNCVFRDNLANHEAAGVGDGLGLYMTDGLVVDSLFTRIDHYTSGTAYRFGGVICIKGGLADRLRIEECWDDSNDKTGSGGGGDIVAVMNSGELRNSLVTRCETNHEVPVYAGVSTGTAQSLTPMGKIVNCTIVANTNTQMKVSSEDKNSSGQTIVKYFRHEAGVMIYGGALINCIVADNWSAYGDSGTGRVANIRIEEGSLTGASYTLVNDPVTIPGFVTADNHNIAVAPTANVFYNREKCDYRPHNKSLAVNTAQVYDWMETGVDLDGRPRILNHYPDLGCFELRRSGFAIRFR